MHHRRLSEELRTFATYRSTVVLGHLQDWGRASRLAAQPSARDILRRTAALRQLSLRSRRELLRRRLERVGHLLPNSEGLSTTSAFPNTGHRIFT